MLSKREQAWIESRRRMLRRWPLAGGACLLALAFGLVALWWRTPLLVDPWTVAARLRADTLDDGTLALMAAMLPVVMLTLLGLLFALLLFVTVGFANERRLLDLVRRLAARDEP